MKDDLNLGGRTTLDPTQYPQIKCDKCGHNVFNTGIVLYNIPGMVVGTGTEDFNYPVQVYICQKCGAIVKYQRDELEKIEAEKEKNPKTNSNTTLII